MSGPTARRGPAPSPPGRPAGPAPIRFAGPDGFELAMHDLGGNGPIMLMAHATGLHGWVFRRLAARLGRRFHCWAPDLRGHGDSPVGEGSSLEWSAFGRDVLAALDRLDAGQVVGFGHSLGGAALLMAADQRPEAFERLVLYEPAIVPPWESAPLRIKENQSFMVEAARRRRSTFASRAEALQNYSAKEPMSDFNAGALYDYVDHGFGDLGRSVELKCQPEVEAQVFAGTFTQRSWAVLERLPCPVHILRGSDTDEIHRSTAADMYRDFGLSQLEIEGLGHFGPLQNPAQLAAEVLRAINAEADA